MLYHKNTLILIEENTKSTGIYEFVCGYSDGGGHSTLFMRTKSGELKYIEQQLNTPPTLDELLEQLELKPKGFMGIYRVDNALFNPDFSDIAKIVK